jgi:hypothetical protein
MQAPGDEPVWRQLLQHLSRHERHLEYQINDVLYGPYSEED